MTKNGVTNVDYVAWNTRNAVNWVFAIRTKSTSTAGLYDESLENLERLFGLFDSFIVPTEIEYWIDTVPADLTPEEAIEGKDTTKRTLKSEDSVTFEEFVRDIESISVSAGQVPYLSQFDVKRSKTKLFLRDGDVYVGHTTPEYYKMWSRGDVVSEEPPLQPAVSVSLSQTSRASVDSNYSRLIGESAFRLGFGSYCFIWFEDTPVGKVNRKRLGRLLRGVYQEFDCVDARFMSDMIRYSEDDVTRVVSNDLPGEAELVDEAREYLDDLEAP